MNNIYPQGYNHWLKDRLTATRTESLATCDNCAMINPQGLTRDPGPFLALLKCCTYFPYIPNFSLGALSKIDLQKTESRGVLLPVGLFPSVNEQAKISQYGTEGFGKQADLLCPFFDNQKNQCSIWENRPGVCTSYFCKSNKGQMGLDYWKSVESYLNHFEWKLACEVLKNIDLDENVLSFCQAAIDPNTEDDEREFFIKASWGKWYSHQNDFYEQTRKLALAISSDDLTNILDSHFLNLEAYLNQSE